MEEGNKTTTKLEELKNKRKTKPTNAETKKFLEEQEKNTYIKDRLMLLQVLNEEQRVLGNGKFNEDEYARKKGRMKMIHHNYEWEKDEEQHVIDEKRLKQTYEDTRLHMSVQLKKVDKAKEQLVNQIDRLEKKYAHFKDLPVGKEVLQEKYDEAIKTFKPTN